MGLVRQVPKLRFLKQPKILPTYVPPDHFAAIYAACEEDALPNDIPNMTPADWWRGLLVLSYMTGWRIGQRMPLKWSDIDLDNGTALTRAEDNGNEACKDEQIPLHLVAVEHLKRPTGSFDSHAFPWNAQYRKLWPVFHEIQATAKLADGSSRPPCSQDGWHRFHDFRRAFATMNAQGMDLFELQGMMQHKSLDTTRLYVNMALLLRHT